MPICRLTIYMAYDIVESEGEGGQDMAINRHHDGVFNQKNTKCLECGSVVLLGQQSGGKGAEVVGKTELDITYRCRNCASEVRIEK